MQTILCSPLPVEKDGTGERIADFSLVQADLYPSAQFGTLEPLKGKQRLVFNNRIVEPCCKSKAEFLTFMEQLRPDRNNLILIFTQLLTDSEKLLIHAMCGTHKARLRMLKPTHCRWWCKPWWVGCQFK
jgi:hypothetical protein